MKLVQRLYLFVLLFAPLAFGTTELWAKTVMAFCIFLCASFFLYYVWKRRKPLLQVPGLLPLLGLLGLMVFQMVPLPAFLVRIISPATYTLYQETLGLTAPVHWIRLTVDLKATVLKVIQFSAYLLFYVLSVQLLSQAKFLKRVVTVVIGFGALVSLLAIVGHFSSPGEIFWFRETLNGSSFGPYVNRNHYAGFMLMLFPVAFCMLLYNKPRVSYESWREKLSEFFNYRTANVYMLLLLAVLLMGASVFVSLSRGGIVCLSVALFLLGLFMAFRTRTGRGKGMMVAAFFGVLLLSVGWFGWEPIFERFSRIRNVEGDIAEARLAAWQDSMDIVRDFPVAGTGSGTFFHAHKAYRNATPGGGYFVHAHNDYIEIASDHGIIGLVCLGAFVVVVFASVKRFRKRHEPYCIYLFLGALTGLVAILIHCLVEFNLQIGANALYFFFLAGLCIAASHTRLRVRRHKTFLGRYKQDWIVRAFGVTAPLMLLLGTVVNGGAYLGQLNFSNVLDYYDREMLTFHDYESIKSRAFKAALYDPFESRNFLVLADAEAALGENDTALVHCRRALQLNPMNGVYLQSKAALYAKNGKSDLVEKFHQSALKYEGGNPQTHANYGLWLMKQGDFEKGAKVMQRAIALSPELTKDFVGELAGLELTYDELVTALPPMVRPYIDLGEYLVEVDQMELALRAYAGALENLPMEKEAVAQWFHQLYKFYIKQDLVDEAFRVMATGVEYLPKDSWLRYTLGSLYEKMGISYRAVEEYEQAVVLNPKNSAARRRLEVLRRET